MGSWCSCDCGRCTSFLGSIRITHALHPRPLFTRVNLCGSQVYPPQLRGSSRRLEYSKCRIGARSAQCPSGAARAQWAGTGEVIPLLCLLGTVPVAPQRDRWGRGPAAHRVTSSVTQRSRTLAALLASPRAPHPAAAAPGVASQARVTRLSEVSLSRSRAVRPSFF